jgi:hypothetical protein
VTITAEVFSGTPPQGWNETLSKLGGTVFHSTFWADYQTRLYSSQPLYVLGRDQDGEPCAGALAVVHAPRRRVLSLALRHLEISSHPSVRSTEPQAGVRCMQELERSARRLHCARIDLDSFSSGASGLRPGALGYREVERVEFTVDLSRSLDDLWKSMKKDQRERVRGLGRRGVTLQAGSSSEDVNRLKKMREATRAHRAELGQDYELRSDAAFYAAVYDCLLSQGVGRLFLAMDQGEPVAASFFSVFGGVAYSTFSGCNDAGYRKGAQSGLFWLAVESFKQEGLHELNRGGVPAAAAAESHPLHGIYTFKSRLGTTPVSCRSGRKPLNPLLNALLRLRAKFRGALQLNPTSG